MSPPLLSALLTLITTSAHTLQSELAAANLPELWLDSPSLHPWDEYTPSLAYWNARRTLLSALGMMTALVQSPREKILNHGMGYHYPAALNFTVRARIPDILADVDERIGLHVDEIARRAETHPAKTAVVLRFLCIHHIFTETSPLVFANNKLSHILKHDDPSSAPPVFWDEIAFRAAACFSRTLRDPVTAHSFEATDAPFGRAFKEGFGYVEIIDEVEAPLLDGQQPPPLPIAQTPFTFLSHPNHTTYRTAFARGMQVLDIMHGHEGLIADFDWARWDTEGSVYVDIGASTGHLAYSLLPSLKHVKFVCQDRPEVCEGGFDYFKLHNPEALVARRVIFQGNNFFEGQPVKGAPIYILQNILHNWPEKEGLVILGHISSAMSSTSRLIIIEVMVSPSIAQTWSPSPSRGQKDEQGYLGSVGRRVPQNETPAGRPEREDRALAIEKTPEFAATLNEDCALWPLLKNYGFASVYAHHQAMEMLNLFNSLDRTLPEYAAMFVRAGLELVKVHAVRNNVSVLEVRKVVE